MLTTHGCCPLRSTSRSGGADVGGCRRSVHRYDGPGDLGCCQSKIVWAVASRLLLRLLCHGRSGCASGTILVPCSRARTARTDADDEGRKPHACPGGLGGVAVLGRCPVVDVTFSVGSSTDIVDGSPSAICPGSVDGVADTSPAARPAQWYHSTHHSRADVSGTIRSAGLRNSYRRGLLVYVGRRRCAKHTESFTTDVTRGVVTLYLGSIRAVPVELLTSGPHWLGVRVDGGEELLPRTPVLSVPYAMLASHALVADSVRSGGAPPPHTTECGVVTPVQGQTRFLITPQRPVPPRYWIDARVEAPTSIAVRIGTVDLATNTIELFTAAPLSRHETLSWCIRW